MAIELHLQIPLGVGIGGIVALTATPAAIRVATRTDFFDRPREYRTHGAPTPFLGGAAVLAAFLVAALAVGGVRHYWVLLLCASVMWAIGTIDDRIAVAPRWRLLAEAAAAAALFAAGLGWRLPVSPPLDFLLTIAWCAGLVNAFNLMDNLDGACATVGCVSAAGLGILATIHDQPVPAGMAAALAAACAGFLRWNLAKPSRIFLGDGGSMPIGFLVAGLGMAISRHLRIGDAGFLVIALIAGAVILDTALVSFSRTRRGVSLLTGGRDHLSHRLLARLGSARSVAGALALLQASLAGAAIVSDRLGSDAVFLLALLAASLGLLAIAVLDGEDWRAVGVAAPAPRIATLAAASPAELEPSATGQP
jgi:UDP-GlcNAc:undecaprenyl-phosphate/decaprenyl-phosphate GlcNAc-1-phosphate transferase